MRHINRCLNTKLSTICQQAMKLETLNSKLAKYIPDALREHITVTSFTNSCLVLSTSDPVWATQMRFHLPELRNKLRSEENLYQLASIKVNIMTPERAEAKPSVKLTSLSANAQKEILAASEGCNYEPLKAALERLALSATGHK